MLPAPAEIAKCPSCDQPIRLEEWASGNDAGAVRWTDGAVTGEMLPNTPQALACPHCDAALWRDKLERRWVIDENGDHAPEPDPDAIDLDFRPKATARMVANAKPPVAIKDHHIAAVLRDSVDRDEELRFRRVVWRLANANHREAALQPKLRTRFLDVDSGAEKNVWALGRLTELLSRSSIPPNQVLTGSIAFIVALNAQPTAVVADDVIEFVARQISAGFNRARVTFETFAALTGKYRAPEANYLAAAHEDNLRRLAALLDESKNRERLEKAEILRALGQWKAAELLLAQPFEYMSPDMYMATEQLRFLVSRKARSVECWW